MAGVSPKEFIYGLRRTLGGDREPPQYPLLCQSLGELEERVRALKEHLEVEQPRLTDTLAQNALNQGWKVYRAGRPEEALEYILRLIQTLSISRVVRSDEEVFRQWPLDTPLREAGMKVWVLTAESLGSREGLKEVAFAADLGITGVDFAIAETATVVSIPRRGLARLTSLAPPVHLAVVRPQDIVERLEDVFLLQRLAYARGGTSRYMVFISGPSKTADIEQIIVTGVHGPKEAHLLLLG